MGEILIIFAHFLSHKGKGVEINLLISMACHNVLADYYCPELIPFCSAWVIAHAITLANKMELHTVNCGIVVL